MVLTKAEQEVSVPERPQARVTHVAELEARHVHDHHARLAHQVVVQHHRRQNVDGAGPVSVSV
jgi:hypothetical protein